MVNSIKHWPDNIENLITSKVIDNKKQRIFKDININMYEILKGHANTTPNKIGVVDAFNTEYTFNELLEMVDNFTAYLYKEKKISKGTHIGLLLYNSIEFIISFLSAQRLGAVIIPFPTKYSKKELLNLIVQSDCTLLIVEERFYDWFEKDSNKKFSFIWCNTKNNVYSFKNINNSNVFELGYSVGINDLAVIIFTSGTTSDSKGVMIKNYNLQHAVSAYKYTLNVNENDSTILSIPIYNVTGLIATFSLFLKIGGTVRIHKFFDSKLLMEEIVKYNITFFHGSPTVFALMLKEKNIFKSVPSLRLLACGSGNITSSAIREIKKWIPNAKFKTVYGLSETSSPATIFPEDAANSKFLESSGVPIPGVQIKIVNEEMKELSINERGEVIIKGTNVISSYYNKDSELITKDNWLKTGDIGFMNKFGYLYIVDRKKDMINRGGEKIYSLDIENAIAELDGINEVAVVGKRDDLYGEVPVAVITETSGFNLSEKVIQKKLTSILAKYEIPKHIFIEEEILKTTNGKVDKKSIRQIVEKER